MGDLGKRLATAGVLVPALLLAILLDPTPYSVLAYSALVGVIAQDEYLRMALPVNDGDRALGLRFAAVLCAVGIIVAPTLWGLGAAMPATLAGSAIIMALAVLFRSAQLEHAGRHLAVSLSALIYVPMLLAHLPLLKGGGKPYWLIVALCTAFFADTVAYFFGRAFGKHKLYPAVSPKKTWEGSVGGVIGSVLATVGVGSLWTIPELPVLHAIALGVLASFVGQSGDLVESMIKRTFGVKDSSNILPGHGGMLDRIDAMLFVAPVVYYFVLATG
jgi:phosphatidate cytidylyltransferase